MLELLSLNCREIFHLTLFLLVYKIYRYICILNPAFIITIIITITYLSDMKTFFVFIRFELSTLTSYFIPFSSLLFFHFASFLFSSMQSSLCVSVVLPSCG